MNLVGIIKLIFKHKILLFGVPIIMVALAVLLTVDQKLNYESKAYVYTGIASGSTLQFDKRFNRDGIFTAFDNLISIIKSRETKEEVAIRLLAQHLLIEESSKEYISKEFLDSLNELVPGEIYSYVVKSEAKTNPDGLVYIPPGISKENFEKTVANLMKLKNSGTDNFIYEILNFEHPIYSIKALSEISVTRVLSSDVIELKYKTVDPGICKQTLDILIDVCKKKYKAFKENDSDLVVKYFEEQLAKSEAKLKKAENELLRYNQENKIINYYEQSKAVAVVGEDMEVAYKNKTAELAGSKAAQKRLKKELEINSEIEKLNQEVFNLKDQLSDIRYEIIIQEGRANDSDSINNIVAKLTEKAEVLSDSVDIKMNKLYAMTNSIEGIPMTRMMPEYIQNMVSTENLEAEVDLMNKQSKEFLKEVEKYAPFGANVKRMERQIRVLEEEYLEILHGLNLARVKYQDTQIGGNLSTIDPPYFPLNPIPSKRKIIVAATGILGFIIVLAVLLLMEFFDNTLKNTQRASKKMNIKSLGMLTKITKSNNTYDLAQVQNRLMEFLMHNLEHEISNPNDQKKPKLITIFSTEPNEGKSVVAGNIARKLKHQGKNILYLDHNNVEKQKVLTYSNVWVYKILGYRDPRIDYSHRFLDNIETYLDKNEYLIYEVDDSFTRAEKYRDLGFQKEHINFDNLDFVFLELPNILKQNYSSKLLRKSDLAIMIARSNRAWSKADANILNNIKETVENKVQFVINGVAIEEVETLLGETPKKRTAFRKKLKSIFSLQFGTQKQI